MEIRIIHLLARKLSGEASDEELAELEQLLIRHPEAMFYAELMMQLWHEEELKPAVNTDIVYLKHIARHGPGWSH